MMDLPRTREECVAADATDPLAAFRERFVLPDGVVYLDGNSLGARPRGALERGAAVIAEEWGEDLIRSWNVHDWFELPVRLGAKISRLVGGEGGCVVTDTTSVNLFKVLAAAIRLPHVQRSGRRVIVSERDNFPTDLYVVEGLLRLLGEDYRLRLIDDAAELATALDEDTAVMLLTHVNYRTGAMWDMPEWSQRAHDAGAIAVWDLCHSVGAVPVDLISAHADFAVGCTYKYLNGGPGAPAFVWAAPEHRSSLENPLTGWWGHARPFDMETGFTPAADERRLLTGTQPIVSLSVAEPGIDVALEADPAQVREKSVALTSLFLALIDDRLAARDLTVITPRDPAQRGSHVSLRHPEGYAVMQALIAEGVIGDYREPEVLRFGFAPLYNRHVDVWDAVETLRRVLDDRLWSRDESAARGAVT